MRKEVEAGEGRLLFELGPDFERARRAINHFGWIAPGEVKLFELAQTDDAKAWVAG